MAGFGDGSRDDFRERVREASDIAEIVGERVALRPAGPGRYTGLCPFHDETAPSFQVNTERGFFHCFGCKESGDVFGFLMKREGLSFVEALQLLARRAGIPILERNPARASRDEQLREVIRKALAHFQSALRSETGRSASVYLRERGISRETIGEYGLGFAAADWDDLSKALQKAEIGKAALTEAGLAREGKRGILFDFFRNRLIVPVFDSHGRAAGFAGRTLDGAEPKYMNSPDSPIFQKRSVLYGIHHQRSAIRRERSAILFEGYFDCLSAWQAGVSGAVAVCGTALTPDHAQLLSRLTREVVLAFDGDAAGRNATRKTLPILLEAPLRVRVLPLTAGRDPDDVLRAEGGEAFRRAIGEAPGFLGFLVDDALSRTSSGAAGGDRADALREVLRVLARVPSPLDREEWLAEAAGPLGFSIEAAREEMARIRREPSQQARPQPGNIQAGPPQPGKPSPGEARPEGSRDSAEPPRDPTPAERDLIRWTRERSAEVAEILRSTDSNDLQGFASSPLLLAMKKAADSEEDLEALLDGIAADGGGDGNDRGGRGDPHSGREAIRRLLIGVEAEPVPLNTRKQTPQDCFDALRLRVLEGRLSGLRDAVRDAGVDVGTLLEELQGVGAEMDALRRGGDSGRPPEAGPKRLSEENADPWGSPPLGAHPPA